MRNTKLSGLTTSVVALAVCLMLGSCATTSNDSASGALQVGDLLFQDLDGSPLCDAIEAVTDGVDGAEFSHVGMVSRIEGDRIWIIEAVSAGVVETPLDAFLARSQDDLGRPKVLVGRVRPKYRDLIEPALNEARAHLGKPYDRIYVMENSSFYCSELLYEAFRVANRGEPVFTVAPMTFNDPATKTPFPAWTSYYAELGVPIPEGDPGLNPGSMSRNRCVEIVHFYGVPAGWRGEPSPAR